MNQMMTTRMMTMDMMNNIRNEIIKFIDKRKDFSANIFLRDEEIIINIIKPNKIKTTKFSDMKNFEKFLRKI